MESEYIQSIQAINKLRESGAISAEEHAALGSQLYSSWLTHISESKKRIKSHIVAGFLAAFLGGLGAHKFYLGYHKEGLIVLFVNIFSLAFFWSTDFWFWFIVAYGLLLLIEAITYWSMDQHTFIETYVWNKKPWF